MNTNIIQIGSSVYDIESYLYELAQKHFRNQDGSYIPVNTLRSGLFAWLTESQSQLAFNSILMKSALYDEHFLNTAKLPESIYNYANMYNYDIFTATPSYIDLYMLIPITEIVKIMNENNNSFVINKDTKFDIKGKQFLLNHDIIINLDITDVTSLSVYYDTSSKNFELTQQEYITSTPHINNVYVKEANSILIYFRVYQLNKNKYKYSFNRVNVNDNVVYSINISNHLSAFNVYYKKNKYTSVELLKLYPGDIQGDLTIDEKFCNYEYLNSNILYIKFYSGVNYFNPENGSEITIETYDTLGVKGNFELYKGNISVIFNEPAYQKLNVSCRTMNSAKGGTDSLSIKAIKNNLLRYVQSKGKIIKESDLNNYINNLIINNGINTSFKLFKVRDDIQRRIYSVYLLIKDKYNRIYPTNTINLKIHSDIINGDLNYFGKSTDGSLVYIPAGSYIFMRKTIRKDIEGNYNFYEFSEYKILNYDNENLFGEVKTFNYSWKTYYLNNPDKYYCYRLPFTMIINKKPLLRLNYLNTNVNKSISSKINNVNTLINKSFVIPNFKVEKNEYDNDNILKISFKISTNIKSDLITNDSNNKLGIILLFYTMDDTGKRTYYGYKESTIDESVDKKDPYSYYSEITTIPKINNLSNVIMRLYKIDSITGQATGNTLQDVELPDGFYISALITYDDDIHVNDIYFDKTDLDNLNYSNSNLYNMLDESFNVVINGLNVKLNIMDISTSEPIYLLEKLDDILYSDIKDGVSYELKKIPLIGNSLTSNKLYIDSFNESLLTYKSVLQESIVNLEGNTTYDMKFFNTYGKSNTFSVNETTLSLKLKVVLKSDKTAELDARIKNHIVNYIHNINTNEVNKLSWSNLTTSLENTFKEIDNITLISINNLLIYNIYENSENIYDNNYIPEYLNIPFDTTGYKVDISYDIL